MDPREISRLTIAAYDQMASDYRDEILTRDRSADYKLFFRYLEGTGPYDLLDLGCGPGRDLAHFHSLGHRAVGLDGAVRFVEMARASSQSPVLHQDLLALDLPSAQFDGVFASASLFHVPPTNLQDVLKALHRALRPRGILFALNPRGQDEQGWVGNRFCRYPRLATWRRDMREAEFTLLTYEYRPAGLPRRRQQWFSTVWQK